jgi:hypothetical protein
MNSPLNSPEVARLYKEFSDSVTANDDDAVRRIYRELLRLGCPRAEIFDEALRLAGRNQAICAEPGLTERIAKSNSMELVFAIHRLSKLPVVKEPVTGVAEHDWGANQSAPVSKLENGGDPVLATLGSKSDAVSSEENNPAFGDGSPMPLLESDGGIGVLLRSPITRFAAVLGIVVCTLSAVLAFLPGRGTAEKATPVEEALAAMPPTPRSSSAALPVQSVTSAFGETKAQQLTGSAAGASQTAVPLADSKAVDHSGSQAAKSRGRPGEAEPNSTASVAASLSAAAAGKDVSLPQTHRETAAARAAEPVINTHELTDDGVSPGVAAPAASNVITSEWPRNPALSKGDIAALLTRADTLVGTGDIMSARLFYERAANHGSGEAALRLGETYDPDFIARARLRGVRANVASAAFWYKRARDLGLREAEILLGSLPAN